MSSKQEYWDACLIRGWRLALTTNEVLSMFRSITGEDAMKCGLFRVPPKTHYAREVRVFVANRLPKISEWLIKIGPKSDAQLLKKLSGSRYDVVETRAFVPDQERGRMRADLRKAREYLELEVTNRSERNQATDWGVTKGPVRVRRAR